MKVIILVALLIHAISAVDWIKGRGAQVAFVEVEAEHANHNGKLIGNDRTYGKLSSEPVNVAPLPWMRGSVRGVHHTYRVQLVVIRYSIPDTQQGKDHRSAMPDMTCTWAAPSSNR